MQTKQSLYKIKYKQDCATNADAYGIDGKTVKLRSVPFNRVKFIAGLWRVQTEFPYSIVRVRDKDFVLDECLPINEKNHFEYYRARMVGENCYGKFVFNNPDWVTIVAKYETKNGTYWSYGNTIEQARAFLGIKLYDEYSDLIHNAICPIKEK